jgi:hypothetical protein
MEDWQVDVKCPICGAKLRLNRMNRHRHRKHPEISCHHFERMLLNLASAGGLSTKRVVETTPMRSSTHAFRDATKRGFGGRQIVSGGHPSLGKKR